MTLGQLLREDHILPELAARDRWGAIIELTDRLFALGCLPVSYRDDLLVRLRDRESRLSTGIGSGVAIPHALCPQTTGIVAAFGRSTPGLEFDSIDHAPVHIIVLFVVPESEYRLRLETLSAIGKTLARPDLRRQLIEASSAAEILAILVGRAGNRPQPMS